MHVKEAIEMAAIALGTERPVARLMAEIERYLGAVDVFRAEGCAPFWCEEHAWLASEPRAESRGET